MTPVTLDEAGNLLGTLAGHEVRPYATQNFGRDKNPEARSVIVPEKQSRRILAKFREQLPTGFVAFLGCTSSLESGAAEGDELVVAAGTTQFDILRHAQTDGVNFGLTTDDLIRTLQDIDQQYGIDIYHAETDSVEFKLKRLPDPLSEFCEELTDFCPDLLAEDSLKDLERSIAKSSRVSLWWD